MIIMVTISKLSAHSYTIHNPIIKISAGESHSLVLKKDGMIWAWGRNEYGQLGDGTTENRSIPVKVKFISDVIDISAGASHSLALKKDGTVWAWGNNSFGMLGNGTISENRGIVQVSELENVISIETGSTHSFACLKNHNF